jgi:hypothetical protein
VPVGASPGARPPSTVQSSAKWLTALSWFLCKSSCVYAACHVPRAPTLALISQALGTSLWAGNPSLPRARAQSLKPT